MPIIKPISDLRNKANKISELVHKNMEPVFITKNGEGDMVVMSIAEYRKMNDKIEVLNKLLEAEDDLKKGMKPIPAANVFKKIRHKHFGKK